jgi:hypothetical protein
MLKTVDIGKARQVAERERLLGQQGTGKQGECGVLCPETGTVPDSRRPPRMMILSISAV